MKRILVSITIIIFTTFVQNASGKNGIVSKSQEASIDSFVSYNMNESGMVGLAAAIIIDKEVVWEKGYGYADKENEILFTPHTLINIASISKTITGVCLMKAVEQKKLSLDEDVNIYLPFNLVNPYYPKEKITLRNLATHTSGITDRIPIYDSVYNYGGDSPVELGQFLKSYFDERSKFYSKDNFLNKKPGTYREYSNIAAALAGYIVELAVGMKLNEYSKQHIFKPLKMKNTGWFLSEIKLTDHTKLYDKQGDTLKVIPIYGEATYPDGGVRTSVSELSRFFIMMLSDGAYHSKRILKKKTLMDMEEYQFTPDNKPENVNLMKLNSGIFWVTKDGGTKIGHGGTDPGVKTEMLSNLTKDVAVILFTNTTLTDKDLLKYYYSIYKYLFECGSELKR